MCLVIKLLTFSIHILCNLFINLPRLMRFFDLQSALAMISNKMQEIENYIPVKCCANHRSRKKKSHDSDLERCHRRATEMQRQERKRPSRCPEKNFLRSLRRFLCTRPSFWRENLQEKAIRAGFT